MKKYLNYLFSILFILPCAFLITACNNQLEENLAVFYEGSVEGYNIDSIQFASSYSVEGSYIQIDNYPTSYYEETEKTGVEKEDINGDLYVVVSLKENASIGTLKMYVNEQEVQLTLESASEQSAYFYKFDSIPTNAKLTFSGKAEYIVSSFSIEFESLRDEYLTNQSYTDARLALRLGEEYLIGSQSAGVDYNSFTEGYENINKSWSLDKKLFIEISFVGNDRLLSRSQIITAQLASNEEYIGTKRMVNDGVVIFEIGGDVEGIKITFNPNYLTSNTTNINVDIGMDNFALPFEQVLYVVDGTEYESITYSQAKTATDVKIKFKNNEFLKTFLNSNKVGFYVNNTELSKDNVTLQGDYTIISVNKPWKYYEENGAYDDNLQLLNYLIQCIRLIKPGDNLEIYSVDEILAENTNLTKIDFSGVKDLFANIDQGGYSGADTNSLYVDVDVVGENYFAGHRYGQNFSVNCKVAYLNENYSTDYTKDIIVLINNEIEITLSYDSENKLNYTSENITIETLKDEIINISFNGIAVNSISFSTSN